MPVRFTKPYLAIPDQIALLQQRGMIITDLARASAYLERIGYYRLSGYWYPFRASRRIPSVRYPQILDDFRPATEFGHVVDLYVFDKKLRLLFLDAIERIEVALRVDVALIMGQRNPWVHRDPAELDGKFSRQQNRRGATGHAEWLARLDETMRRSQEDFVQHFTGKYQDPLPIWMAIELWDFGMLSHFLGGMKHADIGVLSTKYGLQRRDLLTTWMRSINHVRNICAHHARLWNRSPADQPKLPRTGEVPLLDHLVRNTLAQTRLYAVAAVMQYLLRTINPTTSWAARLKAHFAAFPILPGVSVRSSGFPPGWEALPLWN